MTSVRAESLLRSAVSRNDSMPPTSKVARSRGRQITRTPMQWSAAAHAGFTTGEPWIGVAPNYERVNAEAEAGVEGSMLEFYRKLVRLRKELDVVAEGAVRFVDAGPAAPKVIAYERVLEDAPAGQPKRLLVLCSFDDEPCAVRLSGAAAEGLGDAGVLLGTYPKQLIDPASGMVAFHAFEALVLAW